MTTISAADSLIQSSTALDISSSARTSTATSLTFANTSAVAFNTGAITNQALATATISGTGQVNANLTNNTTAMNVIVTNSFAGTGFAATNSITFGVHGANVETITDRSAGNIALSNFTLASDILQVSLASSSVVNLVTGANAAVAAGAITITGAAAAQALSANTNLVNVTGATYASDALFLAAVINGGARALTSQAGNFVAGTGMLAEYDDGTNVHIVEIVQAGTAARL